MLGQPLDFSPGARYAYSNSGYAVLGRIIEQASGQPYGACVADQVLRPMGVTRMRLGRSLLQDRAPGEVRYYDGGGATTSVFPSGGKAPWPYGGFHLEAMDAHGGWIALAVDLARFITAVDGFPTRLDALRPASIETMTARPPVVWDGSAAYYAAGWLVRPAERNWWHSGSLPGTSSLIVRAGNGLAWAVVFNARSMVPGSTFEQEIDPAIGRPSRRSRRGHPMTCSTDTHDGSPQRSSKHEFAGQDERRVRSSVRKVPTFDSHGGQCHVGYSVKSLVPRP